jgi:hypothetical protein
MILLGQPKGRSGNFGFIMKSANQLMVPSIPFHGFSISDFDSGPAHLSRPSAGFGNLNVSSNCKSTALAVVTTGASKAMPLLHESQGVLPSQSGYSCCIKSEFAFN